MFAGFTSTMLKLWSLTSRFQRLIRKSSADMKVSASLNNKREKKKSLQNRNKMLRKELEISNLKASKVVRNLNKRTYITEITRK